MTWKPILSPGDQVHALGQPASGYYIKLYKSGTSTPTNMATDDTGGTTLDKCQINTAGYPVNGASAPFVPHIDQKYRYVLYSNSTDADANTFANAVIDIDAIDFGGQIYDDLASTALDDGTKGFHIVYYPLSSTEQSAGVTPTKYEYPWGDIRRYGAVGDGATNCTTAIANAISSNNIVYVPSGTFNITGSSIGWTSTNNVELYGDGFNSKIVRTDAGSVILLTSCNYVTIRNLYVKGLKSYVSATACIMLTTCTNFNITDNFCTSSSRQGINSNVSTDGVIANNIITDCYQDGIMVRSSSARVNVIGNICYSNGGAPAIGEGIHVYDSTDITITGNIVYANVDNGITLEGGNYCTVVGNFIHSQTVCGISMNVGPTLNGDGCVVANNVIRGNTSSGIIISKIKHAVISGNVIQGNGGYGIYQGISSTATDSQDDIIIQGNNIFDNTSGGIFQNWYNDKCIIADNRIYGVNSADNGILINRAQSTDITIRGNLIENCAVALSDSGTTTRVYDNDVGQKLSGRVTLVAGAATVTFTVNQLTAQYVVALNHDVNETMYTFNRAVSGFEIRSSNGASTANVWWRIVDSKAV